VRPSYIVLSPSKLLHEGTHVAAALPLAEHLRLDLVPESGETLLRVEFRDGVPRVAAAFAYLAPTLVGLLVAMAAASVGAVPDPAALDTVLDQLLAGLFVIYWAHYSLPSGADVAGAVDALVGDDGPQTTPIAEQEVTVRGAD
jgi:hypothetical protein